MKILLCIIAAMSFTFAANDELVEKLADETLQNLLTCPRVGNIDENCKKQHTLLSERKAKLSVDDQEKVLYLASAKFVLEMEKDENLKTLSNEGLQIFLTCPDVGTVDENCRKRKALLTERIAKLSEDDQEKVLNLAVAKFFLEMEKEKKKEEERMTLQQERASLADSGDVVKNLAEEAFDLFVKCKNKQSDEGECKKREKLLSEREKKLSKDDQEKLQGFVMQKLMEMGENEKKAKKKK